MSAVVPIYRHGTMNYSEFKKQTSTVTTETAIAMNYSEFKKRTSTVTTESAIGMWDI